METCRAEKRFVKVSSILSTVMIGYWLYGTVMIGYWLYGTVMIGYWLYGTVMIGYWLYGTVMIGYWLYGTVMMDYVQEDDYEWSPACQPTGKGGPLDEAPRKWRTKLQNERKKGAFEGWKVSDDITQHHVTYCVIYRYSCVLNHQNKMDYRDYWKQVEPK